MQLHLVSPGIASSAGHDKIVELLARAVSSETPVARDTLSVRTGLGTSRLAWDAIEAGKLALAVLDDLPGVGGVVGWGFGQGAASARRCGPLSSVLTRAYRARLDALDRASGPRRIVSSHYLALYDRPPDWPVTLVGPDILAQPSVATIEGDRTVLSPSRAYTDGLLQAGFALDEIIEVGPVVPRELLAAAAARRELVDAPPAALVAVGGSAPEAAEILKVVAALGERGIAAHVLVGDGRPHARRLRSRLETMDGVRVYGGEVGQTRADELSLFAELLARPELRLWISRPNEGAVLSRALGFELWLLEPYQSHEARARQVLLDHGGLDVAEGLARGLYGPLEEDGLVFSAVAADAFPSVEVALGSMPTLSPRSASKPPKVTAAAATQVVR